VGVAARVVDRPVGVLDLAEPLARQVVHGEGGRIATGDPARQALEAEAGAVEEAIAATEAKASIECAPGTNPSTSMSVTT